MRKILQMQLEKLKSLKTKMPSVIQKTNQIEFSLLASPNAKLGQLGKTMEVPKNKYVDLQAYLQKFYNSTSQNGRVNGQHMTFVVGPENSGKSTLIKQSIRTFKNRKLRDGIKKQKKDEIPFTTLSSPEYLEDLERQTSLDNQFFCSITFDFNSHFMMKPQGFFRFIHEEIIRELLKVSQQVKSKTNSTLLDCNIIKDIVIAENSIEYVYVYIKDTVYSILQGCNQIQFSQQNLKLLQDLNQKVLQSSCSQFFLKQSETKSLYEELVDLVSKEMQISSVQSSIRLFLSIFRCIQYENRPPDSTNFGYESGIQTTQFIFSILNYICGFGNLNKISLKSVIQNKTNNYQSYFIGKGNHIDVILAFLHLQNLTCHKHQKFNHWFDCILIKTQNASNLRSHFPIIIEMSNCQRVNDLQKCGRMQVQNPTILQIPCYFATNIFRYSPSLVLNEYAIKRLFPILGRNPFVWNRALSQLSKGVPLEQIIIGSCQFMKQKGLQLENRLNKIYLHDQFLHMLDNNSLKHHIQQFLSIICKCNGNLQYIHPRHIIQIYDNPIFSQFYSNKILYRHYYFPGISLTDMRYLMDIKKQIDNQNRADKLKQWLWEKFLSPYIYFIKELKYHDSIQTQQNKRNSHFNERPEYLLRQYYGQLRDYKMTLYQEVYKQKYNL